MTMLHLKLSRRFSRVLGLAAVVTFGLISSGIGARADGPMMALPGKFSVSTTGGALYSIPIEVPPGTGGMKPELSIDYTSQSTNGPMGVGWALSGIPSITRCPKTVATDQVSQGVSFTASDAFCLSGQRLLVVSGSYGGAGAQYSTEVESYSRIISNGTVGTGPQSFTVWTKSGQIMTFGIAGSDGSNPQVSPSNLTVRSWSLSSIVDVSGNMLKVSYGQPAGGAYGEYVPIEIDYTSNPNAGLAAYNSVIFAYSTRNDVIDSYQAGVQLRTGSLLTDVKVYNGTSAKGNISAATLVSDYRITYQQGSASGRSQVRSITRCGGDGACLPATTFGWQNGGPITNTSNTNAGGLNGSMGNCQCQAYLGNFDGSGRKSVMWVAEDQNGLTTGAVYFWLAQPNGSFVLQQDTTGLPAGLKPYVADFNGDGLADVLWNGQTVPTSTIPSWSTGTAYVWINKGPSAWTSSGNAKFTSTTITTIPKGTLPQFGDFDGDGRSDILWTYFSPAIDPSNYSPIIFISNGNGTFSNQALPAVATNSLSSVGDFDGDGKADILWTPMNGYGYANGTPQIWLNTSVSSSNITFSNNNPLVNGSPYSFNNPTAAQAGGDTPTVADFAGNGKSDIFWGDMVWMSNGDGNFRSTAFNASGPGGTLAVVDFSGDGRAALVWEPQAAPQGWSNGALTIQELNDDGAVASTTTLNGPPSPNQVYGSPGLYPIIADFTGDGKADILWDTMDFASRSQGTRYLWLSDGGQPDLMTSISSLGATTTVQYAPLSGGASYARYTNATYPTMDVQSALPVVTAAYVPNGIGGSYLTTYSYGGAKVDLSGRGFLGFNYFIASDAQSGVAEVTYTRQDYPYTDLPYWKVRMLAAGNQIFNQSTFNYAANALGGTRYYPYLTSQLDQKTDLDGVSVLPSVATTYGTPDANGCTPNVSATTSDGFTTSTSFSYYSAYETSSSWQLCQVSQTATTTTRGAGAPATTTDGTVPYGTTGTRTTQYVIDQPTGRVQKKIVEPAAGAPLQLETDYSYDPFGHPTTTVVIPSESGAATRTTTLTYDPTGQFVIQTVNALGQHELAQAPTYDARFLTVTNLWDANNQLSQSTYDSLGRKTQDIHPDGSQDNFTYGYCNGVNGGTAACPANALYLATATHTVTSGSSTIQSAPTTIGYYDALGRSVLASSQGLDGSTIQVENLYDASEHLYQTSRPYFASGGFPALTTFVYDQIGRITQSTAPTPLNAQKGSVTTHIYAGLTVTDQTVTDTVGDVQKLVTLKDGLGEIVTVTNAQNHSTSYLYDALSDLISTKDPQGNISTATYDRLGRRVSTTDPDMGHWAYDYDSLGELTSQTDAKGNVTSLGYDLLGRSSSRVEADLTSAWTYDPSGAIGKPATATATGAATAAAGYSRAYTYNSLVQPLSATVTIGGTAFAVGFGYDGYHRPSMITTPDGLVTTTSYNSIGYGTQTSVTPAGQSGLQSVVNVTAADAELHAVTSVIGANVWTATRSFGTATGRLNAISTVQTGGSGPAVQSLIYNYDLIGNVLQRVDSVQGVNESYSYDQLNELTSSQITNAAPVNYQYDWIGNLLSRSDVGSFTYGLSGQAGPHQLQSATVSSASPFTAGFAAGTERSFVWTSFDGAASVSQGGDTLAFTYDDQHQRVTKTDSSAGTTTYYVTIAGMSAEIVCSGTCSGAWNGWSGYQWRDYVSRGGMLAGEYTAGAGGAGAQMLYFHPDGLGSVSAVTYASLATPEQDSYDAWGKRRYTTGADDPTDAVTSVTPHGFTGKEQFQSVGLVEMGSQLYDPLTTRMTSASASGGRYAYCGNNPTSCAGLTLNFVGPSFKNVVALADGRGGMPEMTAGPYYAFASIQAIIDAGEAINGAPGIANMTAWEGQHDGYMTRQSGGVGGFGGDGESPGLEAGTPPTIDHSQDSISTGSDSDSTSEATPSAEELSNVSENDSGANATGSPAPAASAANAGTGASTDNSGHYENLNSQVPGDGCVVGCVTLRTDDQAYVTDSTTYITVHMDRDLDTANSPGPGLAVGQFVVGTAAAAVLAIPASVSGLTFGGATAKFATGAGLNVLTQHFLGGRKFGNVNYYQAGAIGGISIFYPGATSLIAPGLTSVIIGSPIPELYEVGFGMSAKFLGGQLLSHEVFGGQN